MKYTPELVKNEITPATRQEMLDALQACEEVPDFMKTPSGRFIEVWVAGCWLNAKLKEAGADKATISQIGQAHGQRSFFGNTYEWAAKYYNEYIDAGGVKDEPGIELADRINDEHIKSIPEGVVIIQEKVK